MPMKRFNIWLDTELVKQVEKVGKTLGVRKTTYMRMAIVEKIRRDCESRSLRDLLDCQSTDGKNICG
jgi:hypothetical protein